MTIHLERLDHLVLTVADIQRTCDFYVSVLGCQVLHFDSSDGSSRVALRIGNHAQKINLHPASHPFLPAAKVPQPGSADVCFIASTPLDAVMAHFAALHVPIIEGPVQRTGTIGPILSVYIRDPDGNRIEVASTL